jgi:putative ABC transport system permease protein
MPASTLTKPSFTLQRHAPRPRHRHVRHSSMAWLWLRWIGRDLRQRWMLVTAIALVLALGTGTYAALSSTGEWRTQSNDASFALLGLHDVEVSLTPGAVRPEGALAALLASSASADAVTGSTERLVVPTQVRAMTPAGDEVLVPGRVLGAPLDSDVNAVHIDSGRAVGPADPVPTVVLEQKFAAALGLPGEGTVTVRGVEVPYVGVGMGPEDFIVDTGGVGFFAADSGFAVVYTTLDGAQRIAGAAGVVNNLVLTLEPGADTGDVVADLKNTLASADPPVAASVTTRDDELSYQVLYDDIEGDGRFWTVVSLLMVAGATLAAVNLIGRVMEGQRREIGIGMALGSPRRRLAVRPFVLALAIAVLGVLLGLAVGALLVGPLREVYSTLLPMPVWKTPFVVEPFFVAAAVGVLVPLLATAFPVRRALRVQPVEAIRVGHLAASEAGWSGLARHLPGRSFGQLPVRNVLRTPRRTALTALGVASSIGLLVGLGGLLDSFQATLDVGEAEATTAAPDRLEVMLDGLRPVTDESLTGLSSAPGVAAATATVELPATARTSAGSVDLMVEVIDPATAPWRPTVTAGDSSGGLLLTEIAAAKLGVQPGDTVTLEHPVVTAAGLRPRETTIEVAGTHPYPLRPFAYLDPATASVFGTSGLASVVVIEPEPGADLDDLRTTLAQVPGVASVTSSLDLVEQMSGTIDMFTGILGVVAFVALLLAVLIAVNSASISAEERRREHATMLAYGLSHRLVLGLSMLEGMLIGLLGTAIGLALGWALTRLMVYGQLPQTLPDVAMTADVGGRTVLIAVVLGVAAVALAPLATARRLTRMDVPATLRLVE